jgi:hypothetical protein
MLKDDPQPNNKSIMVRWIAVTIAVFATLGIFVFILFPNPTATTPVANASTSNGTQILDNYYKVGQTLELSLGDKFYTSMFYQEYYKAARGGFVCFFSGTTESANWNVYPVGLITIKENTYSSTSAFQPLYFHENDIVTIYDLKIKCIHLDSQTAIFTVVSYTPNNNLGDG